MKRVIVVHLCLILSLIIKAEVYDICVYGGTSSGVIAACSASKLGCSVVLIEPTNFIGGLTAGGLGVTDISSNQVLFGFAKDFYQKVGQHYGTDIEYNFEPHVADSIFQNYIITNKVKVLYRHRIISANCIKKNILSIDIESLDEEMIHKTIQAKYFIDCSYEGDLMAKAGVSYVIGRESNKIYNEKYNGVQFHNSIYHQFPDNIDPYVIKGDPNSGLLWGISSDTLQNDGTGDNKLQAYNFRGCVTNDAKNRIAIKRPQNYDSLKYELLLRLILAQPTTTPYLTWNVIQNKKTSLNNAGGFSIDMIGENYNYPEATYTEREKIFQSHLDYTLGLFYFFQNDVRVPIILRDWFSQWGLPKDEFVNNNHWTPQLYIRESRRMVGAYVTTEANCLGNNVVSDGVVMGAYAMDSHNCQRIVVRKNGVAMVKNEGDVEIGVPRPYPISFRSIVPREAECNNLLVPVCLSASHIAYGSIRMEPVFMELGQVAAIAASLAIVKNLAIQQVSVDAINHLIIQNPLLDSIDNKVTTNNNYLVSIFQNPVEKTVTIETLIKNLPLKINVLNIDGKMILNKNLNNECQVLNIDNLPRGVYIINVTKQNKILEVHKIIKI